MGKGGTINTEEIMELFKGTAAKNSNCVKKEEFYGLFKNMTEMLIAEMDKQLPKFS